MFCQRSKMNKIILEIFVKNLSDGIETFCSWMRRLRPGEIVICPSSRSMSSAAEIKAQCTALQHNVLFTPDWELPIVCWHYRNKHIMKITKIISYVCKVLQRLQTILINTFSLASRVILIMSIKEIVFYSVNEETEIP